jgi:hypothetical protein
MEVSEPVTQTDPQLALEKLARLKADFQVDVLTEWGESRSGGGGEEKSGAWTVSELDRLHDTLSLLANAMGGSGKFIQNIVTVAVRKSDIGSHGGEALAHKVSFSEKGSFSAWTVIHEFAHVWDARHNRKLAAALESYTAGHTSRFHSFFVRLLGRPDSAFSKPEDAPGMRGRKPGCNAAAYFYGDTPSGSNWKFNRVEDFAESVAMYIGWDGDNALSEHARNRIVRYTLNDGEKDAFNVPDNWSVYKKYFYPADGDYTKTLRWKFVDELMKGRIVLP